MPERVPVEAGKLLQLGVEFLSFQDGVDPLDGGDADPAHGVNMRPD